MGTRSLTYVYNEGVSTPSVCIYRQMDGYPSGMGMDLAEFLSGTTMVNGLGLDVSARVANGMGCLAAQLIAELKDGPGSIYLYPPILEQDCGQEFEYHLYHDRVIVKDTGLESSDWLIFEGSWKGKNSEFKQFCQQDG